MCRNIGWLQGCVFIYRSDRHLPRESTFSENRLTHFPLLWFRISTTAFSTTGWSFRLQNHKGNFFHEDLCFWCNVSTPCGPLSNVDFTYFFWQNFERISSKQYAITLIPSNLDSFSTPPRLIDPTSLSTLRLLCLKYYRAASDEWRDASNCDICVEQYQKCVSTQCRCNMSDTCFCWICLRQPPSLLVRRYTFITKWSTISPISN